MLVLLYQEEICVCELSGILEIPQPRISQNLSKLRDLSLVDDVRKEKFIFYTLKSENKILMKTLKNIMDEFDDHPKLVEDRQRLSEKEKYLNQCLVNDQ